MEMAFNNKQIMEVIGKKNEPFTTNFDVRDLEKYSVIDWHNSDEAATNRIIVPFSERQSGQVNASRKDALLESDSSLMEKV